MSLILVIEDENQIRLNLQEMLELDDFLVITAVEGSSGLQLAKSKHPDLIICDIMMPGLDGYQVLQELRRTPESANIPLIFLTAKADRHDLRQGMGLGADDYITKPFQPFEILQAVKTRLERHSLTKKQYFQESEKTKTLEQEKKNNQSELQNLHKLVENRENILYKISEDLRNPLSNINMAIYMLKLAKNKKWRSLSINFRTRMCKGN